MALPKPNPPHPAPETSELLTELRASATDLAQFVEAASRSRLSYILISEQAVSGWQERDPEAWAKVVRWLLAQGKTVVQV